MKLFLVLSLFLSLFAVSSFAKSTPKPDLSKATLIVYQGKQICKWSSTEGFLFDEPEWGCEFKTRFTCTATVIDGESGNYIGLTAGHCFNWDAVDKNEYYVSDTLADKPVIHKIRLIKFENDERYDFALFEFQSLENYPIIPIAESVDPKVGDEIENVNYALGLIKQTTHGAVVGGIISAPAISGLSDLKGRFLVNIGVGPGASGSAVVDKKTGKIIGIVEAAFPGTQMPTVVMPTGKTLRNFFEDDSAGLHPKPQGPLPTPPAVMGPEPDTLWQHIIRILRDWWNRL